MGWQILNLSQPAKIALENKQCSVFFPEKQEKITLPLDNLSAIILESPAITMSTAILQALANKNIAVFTCNESHIPNGILLPYMNYFAYAKVAHQQITWTKPFKKRCWQQIVEIKIINQSKVLASVNKGIPSGKLKLMGQYVQTGDQTNVEGQAAALYWRTLFGNDFNREQENFINSALNYGYAILRGIVARSIVANGFIPCFGLHHNNQLNAFNLADDLLEQFRPLVDLQVLEMSGNSNTSLTTQDKAKLLELLVREYTFGNQERTLLNICEQITHSLLQATAKRDYKLLKLFKL